MAVEPRRSCGYRKTNGIYLMSDGAWVGCDRIPIPLDICPTCKHGVKQTRGWTWIDAPELLGRHDEGPGGVVCEDLEPCVICDPYEYLMGEHKCGLLWIGTQFYKKPEDFTKEMTQMGMSRRISALPRNFKLGETWVLLAHPKAVLLKSVQKAMPDGTIAHEDVFGPGIFTAVKPSRIELLIKDTEFTDAKKAELEKKGITPIVVPAGDRDHMGTVYDREEEAEEA